MSNRLSCRTFTTTLVPLAACLAATPITAQQSKEPLPEGVTQAMIEAGREIFAGPGFCLTCHGEHAKGTPLAPDLTDDKWINIDGSYDAIVKLVTTGVPQPKEHPTPMLAKGGSQITDEQVRQVAAYVWSLRNGGSGDPAPEAHTIPVADTTQRPAC